MPNELTPPLVGRISQKNVITPFVYALGVSHCTTTRHKAIRFEDNEKARRKIEMWKNTSRDQKECLKGERKKAGARWRIKGVFGILHGQRATHRRPEQVVQTNEPMVMLT